MNKNKLEQITPIDLESVFEHKRCYYRKYYINMNMKNIIIYSMGEINKINNLKNNFDFRRVKVCSICNYSPDLETFVFFNKPLLFSYRIAPCFCIGQTRKVFKTKNNVIIRNIYNEYLLWGHNGKKGS